MYANVWIYDIFYLKKDVDLFKNMDFFISLNVYKNFVN